jgi:hypothetical protein
MRRSLLAVPSCLVLPALLSLAACGEEAATPDARIIATTDAAPPDAPGPDAFVCTQTLCGAECVDTQTDENYCGDCMTACQSGASCTGGECVCPPSFLPSNPPGIGQDMVRGDLLPGSFIALRPFFGTTLNALAVGYAQMDPVIGTPIDLSTITLGQPPAVGALYNIDINTFMPEAVYFATAGTLTFETACSVGASGTLTGATFSAVSGLTNPMIDPNGCSFMVESLTFSIGMPCPPL